MKHIALLLISLQFVGCVYHRMSLSPQSTQSDYQAASSMMENHKVTIITTDETKIKADSLSFKLDSLIYVHMKTGVPSTIPLPEVNRVIASDSRPYVRNGMLYGAIPGAIIGLVIASTARSLSTNCEDCKPSGTDWSLFYSASILTGAAIFGGFGALAGAAATPVYTVEYHLDK